MASTCGSRADCSQEVDDAFERVEGVVQHHVAGADRREELRRLPQRGMDRRDEVRRLQAIVGLEVHELGHARDVHRAVALDEIARFEVEHFEEFLAQSLADRRAHFESHRIAAAPAAQLLLDRDQQVLGLFLIDVQVRIARHAEGRVVEDPGAREEFRELPADHVGEEDVGARARFAAGYPEHAREHARHLHHGETHGLLGIVGVEQRADVEAAARDERERMRGVEGDRRQDRKDLAVKEAAQPGRCSAGSRSGCGKKTPSFSSAGCSTSFQQR